MDILQTVSELMKVRGNRKNIKYVEKIDLFGDLVAKRIVFDNEKDLEIKEKDNEIIMNIPEGKLVYTKNDYIVKECIIKNIRRK